jgi:hypothetical protein
MIMITAKIVSGAQAIAASPPALLILVACMFF